MLRKSAFPALLVALLLALSVVAIGRALPAAAAPVRIMALGDSITGSPGCWRALLWNRLQTTGYTNIDMVGTLPPQGCGVTYDGDNEGHGGFLATNVANQNQLVGWLAATHPDIVMMHFGTNDVWSNIPPATILAAFSTLVDQMRASNPAMKILVAKIIPMNPSNCADCGQRVVAFNNAIPAWASGKTTAQSPITVVDQWTGFNTATDTYDGVHPNAAGDQKMSNGWYPPLTAALSGTQPTTTPTVTVTPTTPTAQPGARCAATYQVASAWQGAFQGVITVTNTGTVPINGWVVTWTFPNGQVISQSWSGVLTQSGANVTVRNLTWNGRLEPGQSVSAGFIASWNGTNPPPAALTCTPAA
ncbi:cellulose binding domain-containing protein [Flindersiella endophytica]